MPGVLPASTAGGGLNGRPRAPHPGIDIGAPVGTPVLDHGHRISSTFIHSAGITAAERTRVRRGATGRATGAHLDWRISWFTARLDPALPVSPMGE